MLNLGPKKGQNGHFSRFSKPKSFHSCLPINIFRFSLIVAMGFALKIKSFFHIFVTLIFFSKIVIFRDLQIPKARFLARIGIMLKYHLNANHLQRNQY